ncbi:oligosaccharide flippase family protein [Psychroserpens sp. XS_ASV72]|uniref:oligosaccharide flippase family protein n=1 Tax=Psychroserpens sp. XS_ASV72 TaxID=3241293 RepID=UPI0035149D3F
MQTLTRVKQLSISAEQWFMLSILLVNGGNYLYNLILGRLLGPEQFADAAILITFLLVLSFVAMTYQLVTAKFSVEFDSAVFESFKIRMYKQAVWVGLGIGCLIILNANGLQEIFHTKSATMFVVFGIGVPLYFIMSVNRGVFQGTKAFKRLSLTYQFEMLSRLLLTLAFIFMFNIESSVLIALGILFSFGFGLFPIKVNLKAFASKLSIEKPTLKTIRKFFIITAFYELTQIVINNSDILLVKHYFESYEAGLYASLALIGRIVYFIAWMFVMILLPTVIQLRKEGKPTSGVLLKYISYISGIAITIILGCALVPEFAISVLFGNQYLAMAPLLWKYALATGIFAISNLFAYYYLSLDRYVPVLISALFGMFQVALIVIFHQSLEEVVHMQIVAMFILLLIQMAFFFYDGCLNSKKRVHRY